ncbi:hypothetical protein GQ457_14G024230 [Hibiscus cannabinus]
MAATSSSSSPCPSPRTVSLTLIINPKSNMLLLLGKQGMVGCIGNIYGSIENLDNSYMLSAAHKDMLLKPMLTSYPGNAAFLLPSMESSTYTNLYKCQSCSCLNVAVVPGSRCPTDGHNNDSHNSMNQNLTFVNPTNKDLNLGDDGGFVERFPYMVMDDLSVIPISLQSILTLFDKFTVSNGCVEEKDVVVGVNECVELLRASMQSKAVLSAVFLGKK